MPCGGADMPRGACGPVRMQVGRAVGAGCCCCDCDDYADYADNDYKYTCNRGGYVMTYGAMDAARAGAAQILQRYALCDYCVGRLFARRLGLLAHGPLGRRLRDVDASCSGTEAGPRSCHICRGLCNDIPALLGIIHDATAGYEFGTFSVGAIIKPSIMDRDDQIRSAYRLRGADGIKAGLTRDLGRRLARLARARQDRYEPEMSIMIRPAESYCEVSPKPVAVYGRYAKHMRGVPQKQDACRSCSGRGCFGCEYHGLSSYDGSVEGQVSKFLFDTMGGTTARFTWIGGEDKDSLVSGAGRPFFARIHRPRLRHIARKDAVRLGSVSVSRLRDVPLSAVGPVDFSSDVLMRIEVARQPARHAGDHADPNGDDHAEAKPAPGPLDDAARPLSPQTLRALRRLSGCAISVDTRHDRAAKKMITSLRYRSSGPASFVVRARVDGGMPIKRLVTGDGVHPSISEVLDVPCTCAQFDFADVHGGLEHG